MPARRLPALALASLAFFSLLSACTTSGSTDTAGSTAGEVKLTEADTGKPVDLTAGQTLVVTLPSNPTTGYAWTVAQNGAPQLVQQGDGKGVYTQDAGSAGMAGAGGSEAFTFRADQAGSTTLTLNYGRSFEPDQPPANTFSVPVTVK